MQLQELPVAGAADKDRIGTSGVMSQALEFSNEFSRCFLDSQVSGPPIYSAAARSGHAWRTGQGPVCSHDAVTLLVMSAAPWQPEARPEQHSPTLEPAHPSTPHALWISFCASPHCIWPLGRASVKHTPFPGLSPPHRQTCSFCFCVSGQDPPLPSQSGVYHVSYFMAHHHHQSV